MQQSLSALQQSLLATLAYFDLFDYPLTLAELHRYRYLPDGAVRSEYGMNDVLFALAGMAAGGTPAAQRGPAETGSLGLRASLPVGERDGFYYLEGRDRLVAVRQRRYRMAEAKFAKARRLARLLGRLPAVRLVAVCNSLAISNADEQSDIDLFVVCRPGTLWGTRLLVVGLLHLLGLRPTAERSADTFCMSFFLSEDRLDISALALPPRDTYLHYWIASLVPLYDAGGVLDAFMAANAWVGERLPGVAKPKGPKAEKPESALKTEPSLMERSAKRFQLRNFPDEIKSMANMDSRVVISDDILKFHVNDRRAYYEERFRQRLAPLSVPVQPKSLKAEKQPSF